MTGIKSSVPKLYAIAASIRGKYNRKYSKENYWGTWWVPQIKLGFTEFRIDNGYYCGNGERFRENEIL